MEEQHTGPGSAAGPGPADAAVLAQRLLQQGKPEEAFLTAKQALDSSARPHEHLASHLWSLMGRSLEALGALTAAYSLTMKGAARMQGSAARQLLATQAVALLASISSSGLHKGPGAEQGPWPGCQEGKRRAAEPSRIHCLSDVHVDRPGGRNIEALRSISREAFLQDVLLVAGDLGDTLAAVRLALETLRPRFRRVVFVPGNHDLWLRPGSRDAHQFPDSFCKLWAVLELCKELGVDTGPLALPIQDADSMQLTAGSDSSSAASSSDFDPGSGPGPGPAAVWIVPLLSWYNCAFDEADPRPGHYLFDAFCKWPIRDLDVWQVMLRLNAGTMRRVHGWLSGLDCEGSRRGGPAHAHGPGSIGVHKTQCGCWSCFGERGVRRAGMAGGCSAEQQRPVVISMSHFLPHPKLPYSHFQPELGKAVGCAELQAQLEEVQADVHVYGHSHVNVDVVLDSTGAAAGRQGTARRYVQHALEAELGPPSLLMIWDGRRLVGTRVACADGKPLAPH